MKKSTSKIIYKTLPENDPIRRQPDIALARKMLGWEPTIQLNEGLHHTIDYFANTVSDAVFDFKPERSHKYLANNYYKKAGQKELSSAVK